MSDKLPEFLRYAASRKFVTWEFDCTYWLADWFMVATGKPDPIPEYRDARAAESAIGPLGFTRLAQRMAARAGLKRTADPKPGDIGLLRNRPGSEVVGAIKTAKGWVVLAKQSGITLVSMDLAPSVRVMAAWSMPGG